MQVRWIWVLPTGVAAYNVTHARYTPPFPGTTTMADNLSIALQNLFTSAALPQWFPTNTTLAGVDLRDINQANQPLINRSTGAQVVGTSTSLPMPTEVAIALTLRTALTGQSNRGRIFIPGWAANAAAVGAVIAPLLMTDLATFANGLRGVYTGQGLTLVIAQPARNGYTSPTTGRVHPARSATSIDVANVVVRDNHFDTVRRRGLG